MYVYPLKRPGNSEVCPDWVLNSDSLLTRASEKWLKLKNIHYHSETSNQVTKTWTGTITVMSKGHRGQLKRDFLQQKMEIFEFQYK